MKKLLSLLFILAGISLPAFAQTTTTFTLTADPPSNNRSSFPLASQDGKPANGVGTIALTGFFGEGYLDVELPNDPFHPGNILDLFGGHAAFASQSGNYGAPTFSATYSLAIEGWAGQVTIEYRLDHYVACGRYKRCSVYAVSGGSGYLTFP